MDKILLVHKADNSDDVSINITDLPKCEFAVYEQEGYGIAEALWKTLPSVTIDFLMVRLNRLNQELQKEVELLNEDSN